MNNINNLLKNQNIKLTSARKELLELLYNSKKPLSYEEIKSDISMDRATFYRSVTKFEEANIIKSFNSKQKRRYFEISSKPHSHFICNICYSIECIDTPKVELDEYIIENITIDGICKNCKNRIT